MPSPKQFLLQECENVQTVLEETLRYKYGPGGSKNFFEECRVRLAFILQELQGTDESNLSGLASSNVLLAELAKLIWRIERSSLGEYSWPFVTELRTLARSICTEATLSGPDEPLVHVLANGGLDAYMIYPERKRPSGGQRRILTIVFPSSLKHFVLLHAILGHELGHAIWSCSQHQKVLADILRRALVTTGGAFSSPMATATWLFSSTAPQSVSQRLQRLATQYGITSTTFFSTMANWDAWIEEILCDLIGILVFGPSFIAAETNLLYSQDPSGTELGPNHPPVGFRVNLMVTAAGLLNYDSSPQPGTSFAAANLRFWADLKSAVKADPWFSPLPNADLQIALSEIAALLNNHSPARYPTPTPSVLEMLFGALEQLIPPVGFGVDDDGPQCRAVDFRHILYAGWIASHQQPATSFSVLNRLCEQALVQQRAIDLQLGSA